MRDYKTLEIWKLSMKIVKITYNYVKMFPSSEKFQLVNQMQRSAVSITSNIAEGASRRSKKDFIRFLEIALGSCFELETQFFIACDLGYLDQGNLASDLDQIDKLKRMIYRFMQNTK